MRQTATTIAMTIALVLTAMVGTAGASPPTLFDGSVTVPFDNACTGETETVTSTFTIRVIRSNGSFVQVVDSTITTDTGGVGFSSNTIVYNRSNAIGPINVLVDYPDGSRQKIFILVAGDLTRGGEVLFVNSVCVQDG